jgi:hypothetical protein
MTVKLVCGLYVSFHSLALIAFYLLRVSSPCWLSEHLLCCIPRQIYISLPLRYAHYTILCHLRAFVSVHSSCLIVYISCTMTCFHITVLYNALINILSFIHILVPTDTHFFPPVLPATDHSTYISSHQHQRIKHRYCDSLNNIPTKCNI